MTDVSCQMVEIHTGALLDQVLDATFPLWGDGLSRRAYEKWNLAQGQTTWGREHLQRVGLVEGGEVLASAKRYLFEAFVGGQPTKVLGIGAVFTPESRRGQGHAAALIEQMITDGVARGCGLALLFSEIGPDYYERMGFTALPRDLVTIDVLRTRRGAPATMVRAMEASDYPEVAAISMTYAQGASFALDRTPELIEFGLLRRRLRAGLGPNGLRHVEAFVAEEGYRAAAYIIVSRGPEGTVLEECGDRDPTGARIGAMLEALVERDPSLEDRTFRAWLPPGLHPPQVRLSAPTPSPEVMMVRHLATSPPHHLVIYQSLDVF